MRQKPGTAKGPALATLLPKLPATCASFCEWPLPAWGPGPGTNQAISRLEVET